MIKRIALNNFRCFDSINLSTTEDLSILVGRNALGKTSVLEAIYLISTLKSIKSSSLDDLIKENAPFAKVLIETDKDMYQVVLTKGHKSLSINNNPIKKSSEFIANLHTVLFSPSDLDLITGSPRIRRNFLDRELSMLNKKYLDCAVNAKFFLKQRNEALKKTSDKNMIKLLTNSFVEQELLLIKSRIKFINLLNEKIKEVHSQIAKNENVYLKYVSTIDINNPLASYEKVINKDIILHTTTLGYHRDDIEIYLNDHLANGYCSEGQIRNIAISIKIALVMVYESYLHESPILLLDDVFSELDKSRKSNLIRFLKERPQTFITTTSLEEIPEELVKNASIIQLEKEN
ncbi:MAG: DNA replication and repair protein RecF [Acholeplasmatales bacterium]|nr:DNA replication and repair protein RecF [Acholeplasmatales bacterium]